MPSIISDDIGSFPLPEGVEKERIEEIAFGTMNELGYDIKLASKERAISWWETRKGM